ncbi:MAG: AAA family ATPase [Candidatus Krumholzibacteria bacterium]|nr:AAA family ATPase [Candidatus Krumholzibacteria bacterium]
MWIERVALENVLLFKETSVDLAPGLNVVLSPNEGGKSSLFRGIMAGLYMGAASRKSDVLALARWGSDGLFKIELDLRLGDCSYRLVRDFGAKEQAMFRSGERKEFRKGKGVDEFLSERLPLDQNLFLRVCGVRHEELPLIGGGEPAFGERIEEILGGGWGNATPEKVRQTVESKKRELRRGIDHPANEANRGALKRFMDEVERLEGDAGRASALASRREGLLKEISGFDSRLRLLDVGLDVQRTKKEKAWEYRELGKKERFLREKAEAVRKRFRRIDELLKVWDELAAEGKRFPGVLASETEAGLDELRNDLVREKLLAQELLEGGSSGGRKAQLWRPVLAAVLALAGIAGAILWKPIALVLPAAGLAFAAWHLAARRGGIKAASSKKRDELEKLRERRAEWSSDRPIEEAASLVAEYASWREKAKEIETRIEEAAGGRPSEARALLETLDAEYGAAALDMRVFEESRAELEQFDLGGDESLMLDRAIDAGERERERIAVDRVSKDRELAALERMDVAEIAERLECAKEGLQSAERKVLVLEEILATLDEARRRMSGFLAERLPPLAGAHICRITGGRYDTLFIDPMTMKIEVEPAAEALESAGSSPAPARVEPEALSQGARDQIYLAVRLALVELMSRGERQPIFLDDPFVHFDPARRERAVDLMRDFARTHQVVIFTCDPGYRDAGGCLIEL